MDFLKILKDIETIDPEITDRLNPRRAAIKNITSFGSKVALSALPFALGTLFNKAYGQTSNSVNDVLNFALTLEYLESEFYIKGNSSLAFTTGTAGNSAAAAALKQIQADESAHVTFLVNTIKANNGTPVTKPNFDFTANGTFNDVFENYATYLAVAQVFEDTGVRAYKGQAPNLLGNKVYLTAALGIHAVEARHASHIRQMRRAFAASGVTGVITPWISLGANGQANDSGVPAADDNFKGEDNVMQGGLDVTTLNGATTGTKTSKKIAVESFDEPLSKEAVSAIAGMFIKP
ncbi:ferritin-like domain-containing protein [Pedobacter sp. SD-b]|uniref:Ferritin-like domain-containing protein n=1 Tax=Pedobacter segetis TaxID=2793069 RepID=A0ABS1BMB6_9SPHI|nr:ferritin-like domain-containing protein [Pedobacter segetis]MBK0383948.1 ferritin-like domain-containing protein [Pedobacter segetis]